jgi:hypothetical protein
MSSSEQLKYRELVHYIVCTTHAWNKYQDRMWDLRFSTAISFKMVVFWVLAPCSLLAVYPFRRNILPPFSGLKQYLPTKRHAAKKPYDAKSHPQARSLYYQDTAWNSSKYYLKYSYCFKEDSVSSLQRSVGWRRLFFQESHGTHKYTLCVKKCSII